MAQQNRYSPAAASFAQALIELAGDQAQGVGEEISALADAVSSEQTLRQFFADPSIGLGERWAVIENSLKGKVSELTLNFLGVLNLKGRMPLLGEIVIAYQHLLDEKLNRVRVEVTVASKLDDVDAGLVEQRVSAALGKTAIIQQKIDENIIGGLVLKIEDKIIDGSVKAQLDAMRRQLLASRTAVVGKA